MPYSRLMKIEYDTDKNADNQQKHGVFLDFGKAVLEDENRLEILDTRFDYDEDRFITYGMVEGNVWVCVYTTRQSFIRVISVRKENAKEIDKYYIEERW